ncbi:MAG TPA: DUF4062 domain-containing protein [Sedimentisphaerales bacterium]|nr:DUF4062 domain-containing protein [Sedimentisphaerales bacterium]
MAISIKGYHVFMSWQEGLEEEKNLFYEVIKRYNYEKAIRRGFLFIPFDWKNIPGGHGRAQGRINLKLDNCDYLIVLFWDRWGSSPGKVNDEEYSSGTEEEYYKGVKCLKDDQKPMQEIVVFFKEVPQRQIDDPGLQLGKVLEFKNKIKEECLYKDFKTKGDFQRLIVEHLEDWLFKLEYPNKPLRTSVTVTDKGDGVV